MSKLSLLLSLILAASAAKAVPDSDGLYATFDTSLGEFTATLAYDAVPLTVGNFVGLAEGIIPYSHPETTLPTKGPFFDGLPFFSVQDGYYIASGDPNGDDPYNEEKIHNPGYQFADEMHPELGHSPTGTLTMINAGSANANGSQFLITLAPPEGETSPFVEWDGRYSVFGYIVEGMDVVESIGDVETDDENIPIEPVIINSVTIHRIGEEANAFVIDDTFKIPQLEPLEPTVTSDLTAKFPVFESSDVIFETSHDLQNWNPQSRSSDEDGFDTFDLKSLLQENDSTVFFRAERVNVPAIGQFKPGAKFTAEIIGPNGLVTWIYNLGEDGKGTASIVDAGNGNILDYRWYDLPIGAQLIIATDNNIIIAYYLRFTDETTGGVYAHVISSTGQRTNTTGTFEFIQP